RQAQQEPLLFLADAQRLAMSTDQTLRQTITQPATGAGENFHILLFQADFFVEFTVEGFFRRLARIDSALRELPGVLVTPPGPKHLSDTIGRDDADIGAKTIGVDHGIQPRKRMSRHCSTKTRKAESAPRSHYATCSRRVCALPQLQHEGQSRYASPP